MNPFLKIPEFPDFAAMTPKSANEALPVLLAEAEKEFDRIEANPGDSWETLIVPLQDACHPLFEAWTFVSHLHSVCNNDEWRKTVEKFQGPLVQFSLKTGQSRKIYNAVESLLLELNGKKSTSNPSPDESARKRILERMALGAELSGVALEGEAKERFNEISEKLAKLQTSFRNNVLDATKDFSLLLDSPEDVEGLSATLKSMTSQSGVPEKGPWRISLEDAVYAPFMQHSSNRAAREILYLARCTRASAGKTDNTQLAGEILSLRAELANILGFDSYAKLSIAEKSAPSEAAVLKMIDGLQNVAEPAAEKEDESLQAFAASAGFEGTLMPWDRAYWAEKQKEALFSYSEDELSKYFDFETVLRSLFDLTHRLFDVEIEEQTGKVPVWHKDVRFFAVKDETGTESAYFYLDPFSRPESKSGGAWMNGLRTKSARMGTKPSAVMCCNQSLPDANGRCLMRQNEVETLFHEFGHALQHLLTRIGEYGASGIELIEWDAVEIASQFMENWAVDKTTLSRTAHHCETGEPLPEELLENVRKAKTFRSANDTMRQLSFALLDFKLHMETNCGTTAEESAKAAREMQNKIFAKMSPRSNIDTDRFLNSFTHIFAGGYAAGYYGYKWSEVASADAFAAFEEAGIDNPEATAATGKRYRETILALGGAYSPMEVFKRFRGREPEPEALLKHSNLL